MRLINVKTFRLEEFFGHQTPPYAILSHTWGQDELTFQGYDKATSHSKGHSKIRAACRVARRDGLDYLWADTCCIDKTSSAELSEAINSMFAWYAQSDVCYCYLQDVSGNSKQQRLDNLPASRWFTRGWTLQELLAPTRCVFYDAHWNRMGERDALSKPLAAIAGIDEAFLTRRQSVWDASIAQRMSWASRRQTTRVEDGAYCLLGLFDINMPLLYGEGDKAFLRLQEELIRVSNDQTLFCWAWAAADVPAGWSSMLAPSARVYADAGNYVPCLPGDEYEDVTTYSMTNAGLALSAPVVMGHNVIFIMLNVELKGQRSGPMRLASIALRFYGRHVRKGKIIAQKSSAVLERNSFPPAPVLLRADWGTSIGTIYTSRATRKSLQCALAQSHPPHRPHQSHAFLVTNYLFQHTYPSLRSYPAELLDREHSVLELRRFVSVRAGTVTIVSSALLKIIVENREQEQSSMTVFLAVKERASGSILHCDILEEKYDGTKTCEQEEINKFNGRFEALDDSSATRRTKSVALGVSIQLEDAGALACKFGLHLLNIRKNHEET